LSARSPVPQALTAKDFPGGRTQIFDVIWSRRINHVPVKSDEDNAPQSISDTAHGFNGMATWIVQMTAKTIAQ
jgi:hypothetical protein